MSSACASAWRSGLLSMKSSWREIRKVPQSGVIADATVNPASVISARSAGAAPVIRWISPACMAALAAAMSGITFQTTRSASASRAPV